MKKIIFLIISAFAALTCSAQMQIVENSFNDLSSGNKKAGQGSMGVTNMTSDLIKWPMDADGNDNLALLIVNFENMSADDIDKVTASMDKNLIVAVSESRVIDGQRTRWFFIPEVDGASVTFTHPKFTTTRLQPKNYRRHGIYTLTIRNATTISVNINSTPEYAKVIFDGQEYGYTPKTIPDVMMGHHTLTLVPKDIRLANSIKDLSIDVTSTNSTFNYNLYKTKDVTIQAIPATSDITVTSNGVEMSKGKGMVKLENIPFNTPLKVVAVHQEAELIDDIVVTPETPAVINMNVIGSRAISFTATQENGTLRGATVTVNGQTIGTTPITKVLLYGKYKVDMSYGGFSKSKNLTVNKNTNELNIDIPYYKHVAFNPFKCDYHQREWGIAANYISRYYVRKEGSRSRKYKFNGEPGANSGIQVGIVYQPYFAYGQGLSTGVFYQGMFGSVGEYDNTESSVYVPLQYQFRLPLHRNTSVALNAGAALTYGLNNSIKVPTNSYTDDKETINLGYGYNEEYDVYFPDALDFSLVFGVAFQFKALQIEGKYSTGLKDHKINMDPNLAEGAASYKTGSFIVGLSLLF